MSDQIDLIHIAADAEAAEQDARSKNHLANMLTLEICFLALVGLVIVAAFFEALTYKLVSSRTPLVIMVPLFGLILFHGIRLWGVRQQANLGQRLRLAITGGVPWLNKVVILSLSLFVLIFLITTVGHFVALAVYMFGLMWYLAGERLWLASLVALGTTAALYVLFEIGFDVEMYQGLIYRWFAGYRDF